MKRQIAIAGIVLQLLPHVAVARDVYKDMLKLTQQELMTDEKSKPAVDLHVKRYTAKTVSREESVYWRSEVLKAFDALQWPSLFSGHQDRKKMSDGIGLAAIGDIREVAVREERVRSLGRELQLIATSYEAPIMSPEYGDFPQKARAVIRVWQAGSGSVVRTGTGLNLRAVAMEGDTAFKNRTENVGNELKALLKKDDNGDENREDFTAAMWRYMHGVRFVLGQRSEFAPPPEILNAEIGTERQFLKKQYANVENALVGLWMHARDQAGLYGIQRGEVLWFTLSEETRNRLLPDNVIAWVYVEKLKNDSLSGDAGLQWGIGLDPVLPSLCRDTNGAVEGAERENLCWIGNTSIGGTTTTGGDFPPPIKDGTGLCTQPFQRLGYLCRPLVGDAGTAVCKQEVTQSRDKILLSACTKDTGTRATLVGPDACEDVSWKEPLPFNPQTSCKIQLECGNLSFGGAKTYPKDNNGVIRLVVKNRDLESQSPPVPLILHELTHARQYCQNAPGYDGYPNLAGMSSDQFGAICCKNEGEAYKAQCELYDQDGLFLDANGNRLTLQILDNQSKPKTVELNVETCWQLLTDASCRERSVKEGKAEARCPNTFTASYTNTLSIQKAAFVDLNRLAFQNLKPGDPRTCAQALDPNNYDPRIVAAVRDAEQTNRKVCDPNRTTGYQNTIGGSMCYIDQCIEQSVEDHRLVPGRQTFGAGDQAFTAEACIPPAIDGSTATTVPLSVTPPIPPYRPELLIQQMDAALCQQNGLPPQSPPSKCAFAALKNLQSPQEGILETAISLWKNPIGLNAAIAGTERLSEALGARVATELYRNYLDATIPKLATLTTEASALLKQFLQVKFSTAMCAFKDDATWTLANSQCQVLLPPP